MNHNHSNNTKLNLVVQHQLRTQREYRIYLPELTRHFSNVLILQQKTHFQKRVARFSL